MTFAGPATLDLFPPNPLQNNPAGAMTRLVQLTSFDAPRAPWALWRKEVIPLSPTRVWKALTREEELTSWWCERAHVDLRVGGQYRFEGANVYGCATSNEAAEADSPSASHEITELIPDERLRFRWPLLGVETVVTYELTNLLELTELRVTQTADEVPGGWPHSADRPNWWWIALPALRTYLENGKVALRMDYTSTEHERTARFVTDVTTFPWVIWSKLTRAEELAKWWGRRVEIELVPDGTFTLGLEDEGPAKLLALEDGRRLVHDWLWSDQSRSKVEWMIEETDSATRITLTDHGPWDPTAHLDERRIYWASTLLHLKQMSERGETPRDYQER